MGWRKLIAARSRLDPANLFAIDHSPNSRMTSSAHGSPSRSLLRAALALSGAMLCATALIAYLLWQARAEAMQAAQTTALNYARTLEVRLDSTFRRADSVLRTVVNTTPPRALQPGAEQRDGETILRQLDAMRFEFDEVIALRVIDATGNERYVSPASQLLGANYADRSFFATYQQDRAAELLFSDVLTGRVSGRQTMVMTRPIREDLGRFVGAGLAPLELDYFQQHFRQLDIGANGAVFLRRADQSGKLVLRWPHIDAEVNRPIPADHPIWLAVQRGDKEALNEYVAFTDQVPRISGTVMVKGYPFFLTVALSRDDVLAGWRRLALATTLIWLATMAVLSVLFWRLRHADHARAQLETRLREAQRLKSMGTLAGGIAHDFNNIVAAIMGNAFLARDGLASEHPAHQHLLQIVKAGARARSLIQQILAFSRRQRQALQNQALQPVVQESLALLQSTRPPAVTLEVVLAGEPLYSKVDATQIQQVLMNLCTNAWHALQGTPGTLRVHLEPVRLDQVQDGAGPPLAPGAYAQLTVSDTGVGMSAQALERAFEPFFTTKPTGMGTGLGLSVVHGIVAAHGGGIRIESQPGQGCRVEVLLPLSEAPELGPEQGQVASDGANAAAPAGAGEHVLYVDDDDVVGHMVAPLLRRSGYRVTVVSDGRVAVKAIEAEPAAFDIVVTDFNMPGLSGLEVARAVLKIRPGLPVLLSTGYITEGLLLEARAVGVHQVMQKENSLEDLVRLVHEALHA
jgi:signal transduction histidine kinase/CheY-like chemotaxis protein